MKSKQTLKVGQKYRVIEDCENACSKGTIVTVDIILDDGWFWDKESDLGFNLKHDKLQLITPKKHNKTLKYLVNEHYMNKLDIPKKFFEETPKKSQWKYSREQVELWMGAYESYFPPQIRESYKKLRENLLAKSTPKKKSKEIKEIEPLTLIFNENEDFYEINEMRHTDSRIDLLAEKLNQVINTINLLIKNKNETNKRRSTKKDRRA